ncbi:hypothetical protein Taro_007550 [Colocasia esculenta]|uniref:DUF659 domain-containing protein n=1 Tax=Colocasia esculenta TaxID=4460 RepID=A0A843TVQ9_COLES|nr:hypothetical protein [Colocasia esculenta]
MSTDTLRIGTAGFHAGNPSFSHFPPFSLKETQTYTLRGLRRLPTIRRWRRVHDVQGCKSVPTEVKRLMVEHLKGVRVETVRKREDREMQERIISGRQRDEDDDDEAEIYAEHVGSGSGGNGSRVGGEARSRRFSNVGDYFTHIPAEVPVPDQRQRQRKRSTDVTLEEVDPNIYSREHGKQSRIEDAYNQQWPRYKVGRTVAKWWHHSGILFNAADSPYYETMIHEVQRHGLHVQPPTSRDLAGRYLDEEVHEIKLYIQSFKKKLEKYGCTLMCDGWSSTTRSNLINFLVYCDRHVFYHKSIDASDRVHNA